MEERLSMEAKRLIKTYAGLSETLGTLHPELLQLAYRENWFKLFVPEIYGGTGMLLPDILRLEEAIAKEDGSLAWTVTLCSGAGWFAGFLHPQLAKDVFANPEVCFAGSGAVGGTAVETADGYLISGLWNYASGATHATIFTANCSIKNRIKSFILKKEEVEILPGWSYFGLVATGSHAFSVKNCTVPHHRTFEINENIQVNTPGFDYPFLQLAETTLAVNSAGMARHFMELAEESFHRRSGQNRYTDEQRLFFQQKLEDCHIAFNNKRHAFYEAFDKSWQQLMGNKIIANEVLAEVSSASRQLAHTSRHVADELFPYCGLEAAKKETEINRVWRDIHTASQHSLLTFLT